MPAISIQPTYPVFTGLDGLPLDAGYLWFGVANLDPQTNPITIYWDEAMTIAAPQPVRTLAGYPSRSGTPARIFIATDYSVRVQDNKGVTVYNALFAQGAGDSITTNMLADGAVTAEKLAIGVAIPVGIVASFGLASPPTGWLAANGSAVSRTTYTALFDAIGTAFGAGNGTTTFTLPDLRDRVAIGSGNLYALAATGGSKDATVVSHTHAATVSDPGHAHSIPGDVPQGGTSRSPSATTDANARNVANATNSATTGISVGISTTGSSGTNANLQPYVGLLHCIKF